MRIVSKGKDSRPDGESWYGWIVVELDEKVEHDSKGNMPEEVWHRIWNFVGSPQPITAAPGHWFAGCPLFYLDDDGLQVLVTQSGGLDV